MSLLYKTEGLVLSYINYKETSIILKVFTKKFGLQTYVENNVRTAKSQNKLAFFQPLTLVDLVVYHHEKLEIQRLSEVKFLHVFQTVHRDIVKTTIALFITEVLSKTCKEENDDLFEFLKLSVVALDDATQRVENFHIEFLIKLSFYLGIMFEDINDLQNELRFHQIDVDKFISVFPLLSKLYTDFSIKIPNTEKQKLLEMILLHFQLNIPNFGQLKSLPVLIETFS